jgi:hypothetical protein
LTRQTSEPANPESEFLSALIERAVTTDAAGDVVQRVGPVLTLFFDDGHSPEARAAIAKCYESFANQFGRQLRWYVNPKQSRWTEYSRMRVGPGAWVPRWSRGDAFEITVQDGEKYEDAPQCFFHCAVGGAWEEGRIAKSLEVGFPAAWILNEPASFVALAVQWSNLLKPVTGCGGWAVIQSLEFAAAQGHGSDGAMLARRFPGLDLPADVAFSLSLKHGGPTVVDRGERPGEDPWLGIKGVNWLTVVGDRFLPKLGGADSVTEKLGPECPVHRYDGGIIVQAGPRPQLGDVNHGNVPEAYRRVFSVLRSVQIQKLAYRPFEMDEDETASWMKRFA